MDAFISGMIKLQQFEVVVDLTCCQVNLLTAGYRAIVLIYKTLDSVEMGEILIGISSSFLGGNWTKQVQDSNGMCPEPRVLLIIGNAQGYMLLSLEQGMSRLDGPELPNDIHEVI